jgi:hypothetical protein
MTYRYRFISDHHATYGVTRLCRVLAVPRRQGYYEWLAAQPARRQRGEAEDRLAEQIRGIHGDHRGAYGSPRVTAELRRRGRPINRKRVERIMRERGIVGHTRRRRRSLTRPDATAAPAPDLIGRDFTAPAPGHRFVGDITYLPTEQGWLYLATTIDLFNREVVGHAMADHMRAELVCDAVDLAHRRGLVQPHAIFHSDRGSQGEFNRSSQHLQIGGCDGPAGGVDEGVDGQIGDEVAGRAGVATRSRALVLAGDRQGSEQRGCRRRGRRVASGWEPVVPGAWRYAIVPGCSCYRPVFVVRGAGRDRDVEWSGPRGARNRPPGGP